MKRIINYFKKRREQKLISVNSLMAMKIRQRQHLVEAAMRDDRKIDFRQIAELADFIVEGIVPQG